MTDRQQTLADLVRSPAPIEFVVEKLEQMLDASPSASFQRFQTMQLRLKCAEIIFMGGSQQHRTNLEQEAERLYRFASTREKD